MSVWWLWSTGLEFRWGIFIYSDNSLFSGFLIFYFVTCILCCAFFLQILYDWIELDFATLRFEELGNIMWRRSLFSISVSEWYDIILRLIVSLEVHNDYITSKPLISVCIFDTKNLAISYTSLIVLWFLSNMSVSSYRILKCFVYL